MHTTEPLTVILGSIKKSAFGTTLSRSRGRQRKKRQLESGKFRTLFHVKPEDGLAATEVAEGVVSAILDGTDL